MSANFIATLSTLVPATPSGSPFITGATLVGVATDGDLYGLGFEFDVGSSNITVTALGRWKVSGDSKIHFASITNASGVDITGANVSIDMSNSADADGYVYAALSAPVTLTASSTYAMLVAQNASFVDQFYHENTAVTYTGDASVRYSVYCGPNFAGGSRGTYGHAAGTSHSYGPVNFKYHL